MNEKKSERLEVRLGYQEKSDFVDACDLRKFPPQINPARPVEETIVEQHDRTVIWSDGKIKPHSGWTNDTHPVRRATKAE